MRSLQLRFALQLRTARPVIRGMAKRRAHKGKGNSKSNSNSKAVAAGGDAAKHVRIRLRLSSQSPGSQRSPGRGSAWFAACSNAATATMRVKRQTRRILAYCKFINKRNCLKSLTVPDSMQNYIKYSASHTTLVIGDGNFSFSRGLVTALGTGRNITATSYDSLADVVKKYGSKVSQYAPATLAVAPLRPQRTLPGCHDHLSQLKPAPFP